MFACGPCDFTGVRSCLRDLRTAWDARQVTVEPPVASVVQPRGEGTRDDE